MSDHADVIRTALECYDRVTGGTGGPTMPSLAALDALVAERDEARRIAEDMFHDGQSESRRAEAAEAERDEALAANEGKANLILHEALLVRVTELEAAASEAIYAMEQADYTALGCNEAMRVLEAALAKEDTA